MGVIYVPVSTIRSVDKTPGDIYGRERLGKPLFTLYLRIYLGPEF